MAKITLSIILLSKVLIKDILIIKHKLHKNQNLTQVFLNSLNYFKSIDNR